MRDLGVYIHFPFCRNVCPYCDFAVARAPTGGIPHEEYLAAILVELDERAGEFDGSLRSIYFGGGTPSLWRPDCLEAVIDAVRRRLGAAGLEITLETNPGDCTDALVRRWKAAGINRLSIGVQSFAGSALAVLGRDHRMGEGEPALRLALSAGLRSVSADFILGVPDPAALTPAGADPGALEAAAMAVPHLSVYELTIEARTWFGKRVRQGTLMPRDEEVLADAYIATHHALVGAGYEHYEISSYARRGHHSVHNQLYWQGGNYLGLGNGAASFRRLPDGGGLRQLNLRPVRRYLESRGAARLAGNERIGASELDAEFLWLGLRTSLGVAKTAFDGRSLSLERLLERGLVRESAGRVSPTLRGFLYANQVAAELVRG